MSGKGVAGNGAFMKRDNLRALFLGLDGKLSDGIQVIGFVAASVFKLRGGYFYVLHGS
jgi:hypothetical protein